MKTPAKLLMIVLWASLLTICRGVEAIGFDGWEPYAVREEIRPEFYVQPEQRGADGKPVLAIRQDQREGLDGAWMRTFPVEGGHYYKVSVQRQTKGVVRPTGSTYVRVRWLDKKGQLAALADERRRAQPDMLIERETQDGWTKLDDVLLAPPKATAARVELFFRWSPGGLALWKDFQFAPTNQQKRLVRLATVHLRPGGDTPAEKYQAFKPVIEQAAALKADLIVLPETINHYTPLRKQPPQNVAEPVPGPATEFFGSLAAKYHCYIVVPMFEREGHIIYNTAALMGPDGKLVGKYREVCLARNEVNGGICPGTNYPVFQTRFGKVGIMICWEVFFPEPARNLFLNGAEVIAIPV